MDPADGTSAAVHVLLSNQGGKAKSAATLEETYAPFNAHHHAENTPADLSWSAKTMWTLFAVGWLLAPCWWVGVASGFKMGSLFKRKKGLNSSQTAAWYSHILMTVASTVIIVVCCSVLAGKKGPVYSDPYYMTMAGDADNLPDFSNPSTLRSVAEGLYNAFSLDPTYPATSINVWKEGESGVARRRHLLQSGNLRVIIIGYAFAQPEAGQKLPKATELKETVSAASVKITASLAEAGVLSEAAAASLVVGLLAPETKPVDVQNLLKEEPANLLAKLEELKVKPPCMYSMEDNYCEAPFQGSKGVVNLTRIASNTTCLGPKFKLEDCTAPLHCKGAWRKHTCICSTSNTQNTWTEVYHISQRPVNGSHNTTARDCHYEDGAQRASQVECPFLNCTCPGRWSELSGCKAICPSNEPGNGFQTFTYTSTSSEQVNNTECPAIGDSYNVTCDVECPNNCYGTWQPTSCDAPCGPATCQFKFVTYEPADVGGSCENYTATREGPEQRPNCCSGGPAPWQSFLVSRWECPINANGLTNPDDKCQGTCMQGTSPDPASKPTAACSDGTFDVFNGGCIASVPAVGFEEFNQSTVVMDGKLPSGYMESTWEGFQMSYKMYSRCNKSSVEHVTAIGQKAVYIKRANDNGGQAVLKVVNATTHTLELRGLYLWSVLNGAQVNISAYDDKQVMTATQVVSLDAFIPKHLSLTQPGFHNATSVVFEAAWTTTGVCEEPYGLQARVMLDELELATAVRSSVFD